MLQWRPVHKVKLPFRCFQQAVLFSVIHAKKNISRTWCTTYHFLNTMIFWLWDMAVKEPLRWHDGQCVRYFLSQAAIEFRVALSSKTHWVQNYTVKDIQYWLDTDWHWLVVLNHLTYSSNVVNHPKFHETYKLCSKPTSGVNETRRMWLFVNSSYTAVVTSITSSNGPQNKRMAGTSKWLQIMLTPIKAQ